MRKLYSVLAWIIAGGVVVQAAAIAFAFGGCSTSCRTAVSSTRPSSRAGRRRRSGELGF